MIKLDENKLSKLTNGTDHLDEKYGKKGSVSREEFDAKSLAWYYAELLRDERKRQNMTQQQLQLIILMISSKLRIRYIQEMQLNQ